MKRKFQVNDHYFSSKTTQSIYWAGFLAADGYLSSKNKNDIDLSVSIKDLDHLMNFKKDLNIESEIKSNIKKKFIQKRIRFSSKENRKFLENEYLITNKKSLTLKPPKLYNILEIDYYIKGYIDGDGSIMLTNSRNTDVLIISIIGTYEFLFWIKNRFESLIKKKISNPRRKRKNNKNTFVLTISNKNARIIFQHYFNLQCNCLKRKWKEEFNKHCINFDKNRFLKRIKHLFPLYEKIKNKDYKNINSKKRYAIINSKGYKYYMESQENE